MCVSALRAEATPDPRLDGRAVKRVLFDERQIADRVGELGAEITNAYPEGDLLVLGLSAVLRGLALQQILVPALLLNPVDLVRVLTLFR